MTIVKLDPLPARGKRRTFLSGFTLSATAIALLAGNEKLGLVGSASAQTANNDVTILNSALGAEQQAIAAYQLGAESGLLQKAVKDLAVQFQGHHKAHADALAKAVTKLGGKPVAPMKDYHFPKEKLKSQNDVLTFAATLEKGAVSAYLGAVPILTDRTSPRPPPRSSATRRCTGRCCATRLARTRCPTPSCPDRSRS